MHRGNEGTMRATDSRLPAPGALLGILVWLAMIAVGIVTLERHAASPGAAADALATWPTASSLERSPASATLVAVLHPACPCSRSTVAELDRIMARASGRPRVYVLFVLPDASLRSVWPSDTAALAAAIPGVELRVDPGGKEATLFDAKTSGQVFLYDASGALRFDGGITPARGHEGDSAGKAAVLAVLAGGGPERTSTPVFGCELLD
jgi:hypothetical protein